MKNLTQIKFSKEASDALNKLKGRIGMNWNVLCRIGFCMSLSDAEPLTTETYKPDAAGIIIDRKTLIGNEDSLYIALLKEWCLQREYNDEKTQTEYFRAHMNRGIILLSKRIANFKDVSQLLSGVAA